MPPCKRINPGPLPICRYPIVAPSEVTESVVYGVLEALNGTFLSTLDSTVNLLMRMRQIFPFESLSGNSGRQNAVTPKARQDIEESYSKRPTCRAMAHHLIL